MNSELPDADSRRDWLGIACSSLCVLHCVAPVVLAVTGSSLAGLAIFGGEWLHYVLLVLVPAIALWSLLPSFLHHRRWPPLLLAGVGIPLLLLTLVMDESAEVPLSVTGGLLLIAAHGVNWRLLSLQMPVTGRS
ncbi:MAG: MerC domain-containing protein [Pseudomonadota bacterium]